MTLHEDGISEAERERRIASPAGRRLVAAMRQSISERGIAGSTFDRIAPDAGVSRGSIAWYFGTKERLLAEVMRADAAERLERLAAEIGAADSVDDLIAASARLLDQLIDSERGPHVVLQEMSCLAVQNPAIRGVQTELRRRWRRTLADLLEAKAATGTVDLLGEPEGTAALLTALGQGIAAEALADPDWDRTEAVRQLAEVARYVLGAPRVGVPS